MVDITPSDASAENVGLLTRLGDANVCSEIPYTTPSSFLAATSVTQDLREYFNRPRIIASGTVGSAGRIAGSDVFPNTISTFFPNSDIRLAGAYGIRFTIEYTLQVAATPFHQGLLALAWQYGAVTDSTIEFDRAAKPYAVTHLPHVRLNLQKETSVTLRVPFLYSLEFMPLRGDFAGLIYGHYSVVGVLPTPVLPSSAAPSFKVYMSLHDIELLGATSWVDNSILIQSGLDDVKKTVKRLSKADAELRKSKVISSTLSTVGSVLNTMSAIPLLSSVTGTPAWLANSLSRTAAAFGYAAPALEEAYQRKYDNRTLDVVHIDMPLAAAKVSPFQSNKIEISEAMGGCAEDAMSMSYVLSKPSQIFRGAVSTTQTAGVVIYITKVSPMSFWFRAPAAITTGQGNVPFPISNTITTNAVYPSTILFLADSFRYWRGSLKFKFTFSKTAFHGGHLLAAFIPYGENASGVGISNTARIPEFTAGVPQSNAYTATFDLRSADEFEFEVPYIADVPFRGVNDSIGSLSMTVLNPVVTTSSEVSPTINFIVEVSAGSDFEFASYVPSSLGRITATNGVVELQSGIEFQSGIEVSAGMVAQPYAVEPTATIIGEKFNSLKQLAMIPTFWSSDVATNTIVDVTIPPWNYSPTWTLAVPMPVNSANNFAFSNGGKVASMYVFSNGSTRYSALPNASGWNGLGMTIEQKANPGNIAGAFFTGLSNARNKRLYQNSSALLFSPVTHTADIPMYPTVQRITHSQVNSNIVPRNLAITGSYVVDNYAVYSVAVNTVRNISGTLVNIVSSYAAGEDATCAAYLGPPPVILFNSLSVSDPNSLTLFVET